MELETIQGTRLRTLMETWRDNINDCNIVCTPEGIMSTAMDPAHVSLAHFKIFAAGVERYTCDRTYLLGINTSYFHKYIKNIAHHHDLLKLRYDPGKPDVLSIQISSEGSGPREAEMKLLALDEPDDNHIPEQGYNTVLSMVSAELTKIIREMANNADKVWISCSQSAAGPRVTFMSDGEAGRLTYTVNHGQDDADLELDDDINMQVGPPGPPATCPPPGVPRPRPACTSSARTPP
ncbi:MAG: proliferating cell nuclear antigen (pcna), partial [Propionibacteriaceae bacterium]